MSKSYVVISDTQMPFENRRAVNAIIRFIGDYRPNEVVQIGDLVDFPQPSRWNKDSRGEFEGSVFKDADYVKRKFLEPLRAAYDGPVGVIEGNHDLRPREYLSKYAPALAGTHAFDFDVLLDFDGFGVTKLPDFYEFTSGWLMTHGHLGSIKLSPIAGNTALNAAKRLGKSVIMGHTHRLSVGSETRGYNGKTQVQLTGMEVGNLMDMKVASATYLKHGTANWQTGFAVVHVDGQHVSPQPIPIIGGKFVVDGQTYQL
jgi:metallophosphoesterase superfamily enzyme